VYVQTCAGGSAKSVQPEQECYSQQESGCDTGEGITERDTPAGMYHVCMEYKLGSLSGQLRTGTSTFVAAFYQI